MDINTANSAVTTHAGCAVNITLTTGDVLTNVIPTGRITTKGVAYRTTIDEPVRYVSVNRVDSIDVPVPVNPVVDVPHTADADADADAEGEYTTAEMAAMFDTSPRGLRVALRAIQRGVGRGQRYMLNPSDMADLATHFGRCPANRG